MYISVCFILKKFLERKAGENTEKYSIFYFENPFISRISGGRNDQAALKFRVLHLRPLGQLSVYLIPHFFQKLLERTDGKNNKIFNFRTGENPVFMGFFSGANGQLFKKFRVPHLWPLGQLFVITNLQLLKCCTASQKQGGFGPPEGIRTPVLQNRNLLRYPAAPQAVT